MSVKSRALHAIDTRLFSADGNVPEELGPLSLSTPMRDQHVLRMLIRRPFGRLRLPSGLHWALPLIGMAESHQAGIARHPFLHLTVRNGVVRSEGDDEWHVDGFSTTYSHLPEQNYVWTDKSPTQYYDRGIDIPDDFDPLRHNLHTFIKSRVDERAVRSMKPRRLYVIDPYVIHRRPPSCDGVWRCFVRLSYTPIEIADVNNTANPLMPTSYSRDGVAEFRDRLVSYDDEVSCHPSMP